MNEQSSIDGDWMHDITPKTATLKIRAGESKDVIFKNNGKKKASEDYGESVAFLVALTVPGLDLESGDMTWYVKSNNFDLLGQIKELAKENKGTLVAVKARISRVGEKKSDTRYKIVKI